MARTVTSVSIDADLLAAAKASQIGISRFLEYSLKRRLASSGTIDDQLKVIENEIENLEKQRAALKIKQADILKAEKDREAKDREERLKRVYEEIRQLVYMKIEQGETLDNVLAYIDELKTNNEPVADRLDKLKESLRKGLFETIIKDKEKRAEENGRGN